MTNFEFPISRKYFLLENSLHPNHTHSSTYLNKLYLLSSLCEKKSKKKIQAQLPDTIVRVPKIWHWFIEIHAKAIEDGKLSGVIVLWCYMKTNMRKEQKKTILRMLKCVPSHYLLQSLPLCVKEIIFKIHHLSVYACLIDLLWSWSNEEKYLLFFSFNDTFVISNSL